MVMVSAAIREIEGADKKSMMVMVPLGMALPPGLRAAVYTKEQWAQAAKNEKIDEKAIKPISLKYSLCHASGCTAEIEATADIIEQMKTGGGIMVIAMNAGAQPIGFPVPLDGFVEAFAGKPVDNKEYAKARGQLMAQIRERQQAALEKYKAEQMKNLPPPPAGASRSCRCRLRRSKLRDRRHDESSTKQKAARQHSRAAFCVRPFVSVRLQEQRAIAAVLVLGEQLGELRMPQRLAGLVGQQVLLGDVGDVFGLRVLREQVIEGLLLVRADLLGNRQPPFLGVVELGIDVEDDAAERVEAVAHDLPHRIFRLSHRAHSRAPV